MSVQATMWAWQQNVPSGAKFVLLALADFADGDGECYPGQKRLAAMTGMSERTVRRHLADMEKAGLLEATERRRRDGSRTSDLYQLRMPNQPANMTACTTGQKRQVNRPKTTESPANMTGHELSVEPSVEPSKTSTPPTPPAKKSKDEAIEALDLPEGVDRAVWVDFVRFRREGPKGKPLPLTERAAKLVLRTLQQAPPGDRNEMLERTIMSGWSGVFPLDKRGPKSNGAPKREDFSQKKYTVPTSAELLGLSEGGGR